MSDFKETCIWMSYRYAIGRKTIAATSHAYDIAHNMDWVQKEKWQFTGIDILREINSHIRCYKNIKVVSYGDPDYDVFSIIFEWFLNNPQDDNVEYFMTHKWDIDTLHGTVKSVTELSEEEKPVRKEGIYYEANIFSEYSDYKGWIKLANMFLENYKYVTYEFDGKVQTVKCIEWYDLDYSGKISKKYTASNEAMSGWYIAPDYIKAVSDRK